MSDWQIRRDRHYDLMANLDAELRGVIQGACERVALGHTTAEKALARIREKEAQTAAAIAASWSELLGGAR